MIYLDNAATSFPKPQIVYQEMDKATRTLSFNAGRGHYKEADRAFEVVEEARKYLCEQANASNLIFSASATHSLNQIVSGYTYQKGDIIYCSPYDHNAIARTLYAHSKKYGFKVKQIPLKKDLTVDIDQLALDCALERPKMIYCTHVSNVTGYVLPIEQIGEIAAKYQSIFVVDGAQAFGIVPINLKKYHIDYYVFAGHKTLHGPFGIGGFLTNECTINPSFFGGTGTDSLNLEMPTSGSIRYEPSSPNVPAIAAMYAGAKWTFDHNVLKHEADLYNYARSQLESISDVIVYQPLTENMSGIISFNIRGMNCNDAADILAQDYDIALRSGYHCAPYIHDYLGTKMFNGCLRASFGYFVTKEDIDQFIDAVDEISLEG